MTNTRERVVQRAEARLRRADRRRRLSVQGTARAGQLDKLKRISLILQLIAQRVPRVDIVQIVMRQFMVGQSMAYRYYNQAVKHAARDFGTKNIRRLFVEQVYNLRTSIREALREGEFHAASSMQQHLSDILGFRKKDNDGPSVHVQVSQNQSNQQASVVAPQIDGSMAQHLAELTNDELERRLARIIGSGERTRTALAAPVDVSGSSAAADVVGTAPPPQYARGEDGLPVIPVPAPVVRRSVRKDRATNGDADGEN